MCWSYPGHVLPPSVDVVLHPAQHGAVHFLLGGNVEVVAGDQIQDLGRKGDTRSNLIHQPFEEFMVAVKQEAVKDS